MSLFSFAPVTAFAAIVSESTALSSIVHEAPLDATVISPLSPSVS